jgi:hypothetical protein
MTSGCSQNLAKKNNVLSNLAAFMNNPAILSFSN